MIDHPGADEYASFYGGYIATAADRDPVDLQREQLAAGLLERIPDTQAGYRYAPGKWSVREVIGHMADTERIMTYRAVRIARADQTPLPGFDENDFVAAAGFERRSLASVVDEWKAVRQAAVSFFGSLTAESAARQGIVNDGPMSVRALAYIIPGHFAHHARTLRDRYGITA